MMLVMRGALIFEDHPRHTASAKRTVSRLEPRRSRSVFLLSYTLQLCCSLFTATGRCQTREQVQLLDDNIGQHDCHEQHQSKADRETSNAPGDAPAVVDRSAMCWPAVGSRIHPGFTLLL